MQKQDSWGLGVGLEAPMLEVKKGIWSWEGVVSRSVAVTTKPLW